MVKLTADLLLTKESYLNPLKDRELDLRGLNIPAIENLGVTKNQLDSIDLTDNAITSLSNLPQLPRLKSLLLSQNPIAAISPNLARALPALNSLVLTSSAIKDLADLDPLASCRHLEFLSLKGSPVASLPHYRLWLIFRCKNLRVLDFDKIKDKERKQAASLFLDANKEYTALANSISAATTASTTEQNGKTFNPGEEEPEKGRLLTSKDKEIIKQAIEAATSIEEIKRLQRSLDEGFVPDLKELARLRGKAKPTAAAAGDDMDME